MNKIEFNTSPTEWFAEIIQKNENRLPFSVQILAYTDEEIFSIGVMALHTPQKPALLSHFPNHALPEAQELLKSLTLHGYKMKEPEVSGKLHSWQFLGDISEPISGIEPRQLAAYVPVVRE
jgi:hypothetical protein